MKFEKWKRHKGSVYRLDMKQFEPLLKLRAVLEKLEQMDISRRTIRWIASYIASIINHQAIRYESIINPSPLYRAQTLGADELEMDNISRLWYPPVDKVRKFGRANRVGQQVFYCASHAKAVLFEVDPKPSVYFGLVECALSSEHPDVNLVQLGIDREFLSKHLAPKQTEELVAESERIYDSNLTVDGIPISELSESFIVQRFFHKMFSRKIKEDEHDFYKMTIAIAEIWLHNEALAGIAYPTITSKFLGQNIMIGQNFAFRKEWIDSCYSPSRVWLCQCDSLTEKGYAIKTCKSSNQIGPNGKINWHEEPIELPL